MANFFEGLKNLALHPVNEAQFLFDVGRGKIDLKDAPGKHQEMMNDITVPLGGRNKITENSDAVAGAVVASIFAAPLMAGSSGSGLGSSEFATMGGGNKFGSMNFGPSFSGGAPTSVPDFSAGSGTGSMGGWKPFDFDLSFGDGGSDFPWADVVKSGFDAMGKAGGGDESDKAKLHRPGFKGAQLPAQQYDGAALQDSMASQQFQQIGAQTSQIDLNSLLKTMRKGK